ncbi:hypothetical protein PHYPSEUDO_010461 [Phytophthora pseudosyringae]|uniref:Borealin N-terminal domain-containing protein n=1 Tax=Phytophthora pseudosyringae TaxID=221518 RepID=A0A8T1VDE2_9STRA|nr:hypothetical protein PHYPSEUDO_010461 [Phytophthora pseudosyringae]
MAPSSRRRVGRTLHRPRRRSAANGSVSTRSTAGAGPLQAIGENTVVELPADEALDASSARFGLPPTTLASPSPKKQSQKKKRKKRPRESTAFPSKKKRSQQLETLLDELETQVQEQCDELVADAERRAQELEMELKLQLLYLPKPVRLMPWRTFVDDFGGDLHNVIHSLSQSQTSLQASPPRTRSSMARHDIVAATPCSVADPEESEYEDEPESDDSDHDPRGRRPSAFTTPMDRRRAGAAPRTVLRTARKGETTYSVRGSPIISDTVAKAKAPTGSLVATFEKGLEPTSCCVQLDSDRVLDLSRPEELSAESRGEATSKLKALQAKVAQLLRQINPYSS